MSLGMRVERYRFIRILAPLALVSQLGIRFVNQQPALIPDLFIFNLAAFFAALSAWYSPLYNDRLAVTGISLGIALWAIGSSISTAESFYSFRIWRGFSDICYSLFYPLILLGLVRTISSRHKLRMSDFLDVLIIGLGSTSVLASFLLKPAMITLDGTPSAVFLAILYPIGDIILLTLVILALWMQKFSFRTILLLLGILSFTTTDLYFIWRSAVSAYPFASLFDDGWILGLILLSEALWHPTSERELNSRVISFSTLVSLLASGLLLLLAVIRPSELPTFVLIPAFGTLALSFIRMSIALREAREIKDERLLA
jgi:hypothetical protein